MVDLDRRGYGEKLGTVKGKETIIKIYCMKVICFQ